MELVDLHCHILPGVDDGARDEADAIAMARQGAADGIGVICATPHIRHDHDVRIAELAERAAALDVLFARHGIPVVVSPAGEVAETALDALDETELRRVSLGGHGRWVLVEPAPGPLGDSLDAAVERLAGRGARAIVAHPERHLGPGFADRLAGLVARGALIQPTAAHVLDEGAGPVLCDLAARGLVHVVGSDAHSSLAGRPVAVAAAIDRLGREAGPEVAAFARDAPAAMLRGEDPAQAGVPAVGA